MSQHTTKLIKPQLNEEWLNLLENEFKSEYFEKLKSFLIIEKEKQLIYPPGKLIFNALNLTPFSQTKVVIIGQDPYHGTGQAHGLSFSVPKGVKIPPSLQNIFKELHADISFNIPEHGNLEKWAKQGVLLLNATLTVRAHQAGSHQNKGWENFTDAIIKNLSEHKEHLVFFLWGGFARKKLALINKDKHLVLESAHPSPLSAYNGFFGCKHFSKCNAYLQANNYKEIDWSLD
jgi:uracil-DNA glycosylase